MGTGDVIVWIVAAVSIVTVITFCVIYAALCATVRHRPVLVE